MTDNEKNLKPDANMATRTAPGGLSPETARNASNEAPSGAPTGEGASPSPTATSAATATGATVAAGTGSRPGRVVPAEAPSGAGKVDTSAAQPRDGFPTAHTDHGVLDEHAVDTNRVGGQGVVHKHAPGAKFPPEAPPKR